MRVVLMLGRHLTSGNADELMAAATHKSRFEVQRLLAERYPQPDVPERLQPIPPQPFPVTTAHQSAAEGVRLSAPERIRVTTLEQPSQGQIGPPAPLQACQAPGRAESKAPTQRVTPLAPERFGLQLTLDWETYDLMEEARALTGHRNPTGEILPLLKSALQCYVGQLRKQKFAATTRPRPSKPGTSPRHIPASVKQAVWVRDGGRCTFVSDNGQRCPARSRLEFDHREPVARGGQATPENVRLVCRSHNQYAAERAFGADFMDRKRREARETA